MIDKKELLRWLKTLPADADVAIDDGGLTMVELDEHNQPTGAYLEIGGVPLDEEDDA